MFQGSRWTSLLLLVTLMASAHGSRAEASGEAPALSTVWAIHLEIPAEEFDSIQHAAPRFPGAGGQPIPPSKPSDRESERNQFGLEFPWGKGGMTVDGEAFTNIGIRYDGNITYLVSARELKRPLMVRLGEQQRLHGMNSFRLHSMPLDPAKAREMLAFSVFRAVGVPVPRTVFAEVTLTVPGKYDKQYLGLHTLVEDVGPRFLADRFQTDNGLLMKPFQVRGIAFLGHEWNRYQVQYRPQRDATDDEAERVIEFAQLVNQSTDDEFAKQIGSFIDVDAFLRFMAANALTSNLESFFALGHNYNLYLDPRNKKFTFIPSDLENADLTRRLVQLASDDRALLESRDTSRTS